MYQEMTTLLKTLRTLARQRDFPPWGGTKGGVIGKQLKTILPLNPPHEGETNVFFLSFLHESGFP
jgi:hypothetical protein